MFIETPTDGYHFTEAQIKIIEDLKGAKYMGYWCTKRPSDGSWNERPVDVFYQPNPDIEQGHKHYFGVFVQGGIMITDATSAFSEPIIGSVCEDGEVIVSRYRHDYVAKKGAMIDGGRDYTRTNMCPTAKVTVYGGEFVIQSNVVE